MGHPLLGIQNIPDPPFQYLRSIGSIFAIFGSATQDSGNISYGVQVDDQQYFVKTSDPTAKAYLNHEQRIGLLNNAQKLNDSVNHVTQPVLFNLVESAQGPMLVYEWVQGELLRCKTNYAGSRFCALPAAEITNALQGVFELHHKLALAGWVACDFYDGCLIYDFEHRVLHVIDLDTYRQGPFINDMGRMFGSSRFMAAEEFELGAVIDQRTTVFNMGRTMSVFLADGSLEERRFRGNTLQYEVMVRACARRPDDRFQSVQSFYESWKEAIENRH